MLAVIPEGDEGVLNGEDGANGGDKEVEGDNEGRTEVETETEVQQQLLNVAVVHETQKNIHDTDEGNWSDVSPSKQGRSNHKTNEDTSIISSPSRFAVLSEEKESGSNLQVEAEVHEEGEILENTSHVSSDDQNRLEHQKQEMGDGNIRRTSAPNSKISTKSLVNTNVQSASNQASDMGKKRNTKKN